MKVGDLVTPVGWLAGARGMRKPAMGIVLQINRDLRGVNGAAMVYWSNGKIDPWLFEDLEIINESR